MGTKVYLGVSVLIWFGYGLACFVNPSIIESTAGLRIDSAVARTEVRAMYGGLQMAIGVMALAALFNPRFVQPTLFSVAFLVTGLAASRLLGALIDTSFAQYTYGAVVFEFVAAGCAMVLLRRGAADSAATA